MPAVSENLGRRFVVIDKNTFGIFSCTGTMVTGNTGIEKYRGYKTDWDGPGQSVQQEFQRLGRTNHKGKIVKKGR